MAMILIKAMIPIRSGPVFCLLLGVSSHYAKPITGQVTEVTCPVIGRAQPELTPGKRQKTGPGLASERHWTNTGPFQNNQVLFVLSRHLKSPATRLFNSLLSLTTVKNRNWPFVKGIPLTKGHSYVKCVHVMTRGHDVTVALTGLWCLQLCDTDNGGWSQRRQHS